MSLIRHSSLLPNTKSSSSKSLNSHIQKALTSDESPPKSKHIRSVILETFRQKSSSFLFSIIPELQVANNPIVCWKYLMLVHKILRSGHSEALRYDMTKINAIEELKSSWKSHSGRFYKLILDLCRLIVMKFKYHRRYPFLPGDFEINMESLLSNLGNSADSLFGFCIDSMNYLDNLLSFQQLVFDSIDRKTQGTSELDKCKLYSLIQCALDCASLYDLTLKVMIQLHTISDSELLSNNRSRFTMEHILFREFFSRASRCEYLKSILQIPVLSESPPDFCSGLSIDRHIPMTVTENTFAQSFPGECSSISTDNQLVRIETNAICETPFVKSTSSPFQKTSQQTKIDDENFQIIESLHSEIRRVQNESTTETKSLMAVIKKLEEENMTLSEDKFNKDDEIQVLSARIQSKEEAETTLNTNFKKISSAYTKLRQQHIEKLQELEDLQKNLKKLQNEQMRRDRSDSIILLESEKRISPVKLKQENMKGSPIDDNLVRMLKLACESSIAQLEENNSLLDDTEYLHCRSSTAIASSYISRALSDLNTIQKTINGREISSQDLLALTHMVSSLSFNICAALFNAKAVGNFALSVDSCDVISTTCKKCHTNSIDLFSSLPADSDKLTFTSAQSHCNSLKENLSSIKDLVEMCMPKMKDVEEVDLSKEIEMEMQKTLKLVAQAEERFKNLLKNSPNHMTEVQLKVHSRIIQSCSDLMASISMLVANASKMQTEIIDQKKGAVSVKEFYKRHNRWSEGLISAAKAVGAGANLLIDSADEIVSDRGGKLEKLLVAASEISSGTTQLLVASRVKAKTGSLSLAKLENAARDVSRMTGKIIAESNEAVLSREEKDNTDIAKLSVTQAKRAELEIQVHILELEATLTAERKRLANCRRCNYSNSAEVEHKA